jgi:hypothetical protein
MRVSAFTIHIVMVLSTDVVTFIFCPHDAQKDACDIHNKKKKNIDRCSVEILQLITIYAHIECYAEKLVCARSTNALGRDCEIGGQ